MGLLDHRGHDGISGLLSKEWCEVLSGLVRRLAVVSLALGVCTLAIPPHAVMGNAAVEYSDRAFVTASVACDQTIGRNKVTWMVASTDTSPIYNISVTPAGSTLDIVQTMVWSGTGGVPTAVETVPLGVTSATVAIDVVWANVGAETLTGSVTFSPRCGPSRPWATFTYLCDHVSTLVAFGNDAAALGPAELAVMNQSQGTVVGVFLLLPGEQRTLTINEPALINVVQHNATAPGLDFSATNFSTPPNPDCGPANGPPTRGEVPPGAGAGSGAGGGSDSGSQQAADPIPSPSISPDPSSTGTSSITSVATTSARSPVAAANRSVGPLAAYAGVVVALLIGLLATMVWMRRRRSIEGPSGPAP
jgi:hypothetical protein